MDSPGYQEFMRELMNESDRAAIVLGAAHIDRLLGDILSARLIDASKDLFEFNGPLGTFSAKIEIAHAVGVIDNSFSKKIHLIRKIRNECAHNIENVDLDKCATSARINSLADAFSSTEFWSRNLQEAGEIFKLEGQSLVLRFSIALIVVNLALIGTNQLQIDRSSAAAIKCPRSET